MVRRRSGPRILCAAFQQSARCSSGIIRGKVDLAQLSAVSLEMRSFSLEKLAAAIADAKANNGWIAFYTHGVSDNPTEYDSTPRS